MIIISIKSQITGRKLHSKIPCWGLFLTHFSSHKLTPVTPDHSNHPTCSIDMSDDLEAESHIRTVTLFDVTLPCLTSMFSWCRVSDLQPLLCGCRAFIWRLIACRSYTHHVWWLSWIQKVSINVKCCIIYIYLNE